VEEKEQPTCEAINLLWDTRNEPIAAASSFRSRHEKSSGTIENRRRNLKHEHRAIHLRHFSGDYFRGRRSAFEMGGESSAPVSQTKSGSLSLFECRPEFLLCTAVGCLERCSGRVDRPGTPLSTSLRTTMNGF
jgi:hypothetical protein